MIYEQGYEYYTDHVVESFLGNLKVQGCFVQDSPETFHGWLHVLGKKREILEAKMVDGKYNYYIKGMGLKVSVEAELKESYSMNGYSYTAGKAPMKFCGGAVKRVSLADGTEEAVGTWQR